MTLSSRKQRADGARTRERILAEALPLFAARGFAGTPLEEVVDVRTEGNEAAAAVQKQIDSISDETDDLLGQYRTVLKQIDSIRVAALPMAIRMPPSLTHAATFFIGALPRRS